MVYVPSDLESRPGLKIFFFRLCSGNRPGSIYRIWTKMNKCKFDNKTQGFKSYYLKKKAFEINNFKKPFCSKFYFKQASKDGF